MWAPPLSPSPPPQWSRVVNRSPGPSPRVKPRHTNAKKMVSLPHVLRDALQQAALGGGAEDLLGARALELVLL